MTGPPRKAGNWLRGFQFYTKESEAPDSFLLWAGITAVAGATQRQVWTRWVYRRWFPNTYLMLVGPTGSRKSSALFFARDMMKATNIPLSSDALTKEAIIEQMVERNKTRLPKRSALTICVSEFMTFFGNTGLPMLEFLTDVYDCHDKWEYATRKRGVEPVDNVFLNLLGATTPSWLSETFTPAFTDHGFVGRTVFVAEDGPRFRKSRPKETREMQDMYVALLEDLARIATLKGEFQWSQEGEEYFDNYYDNEYPLEKIDYRLSGYLERKPAHILKTAMVLAIADSDSLVLTSQHFATARQLLEQLEPKMVKAFRTIGRNIHAQDLERIYADILTSGGMSDAQIRERHAHNLDKQRMEEQIESLKLMGRIGVTIKNGSLFYIPKNGAGP